MTEGWIKLHRKILDNQIAAKPMYAWLWVTLLLMANHEDKKFIFNCKSQIVKRGQVLTGREKLSTQTGISATTVENILRYLEKEGQIGQQKTNKFRLITLNNYDTYQEIGQQKDSKVTANGQQTDTNKNVKNDKNVKKISSNAKPPEGDVVDDLLKNGQGIQHEFQYVGLEIFEKMGAPSNKRGECMRIAKELGSELCYEAMSWVSDYPGAGNKFKLFLWKVNKLRSSHGTTTV